MSVAAVEPTRYRFTPRSFWWSLDRTRSAELWDELGAFAGSDGVASFRFVGDTCWVVTDPGFARHILTSPPDVVGRSGTFKKLRVFVGDSLLTTEGPAHRLRRRQVQPAFSRDHLRVYATGMVAAAQATAAGWNDSDRVAMDREMAALTMDAIGRSVLGVDGRRLAPIVGTAIERLMRAMPLLFIPKVERIALKPIPGFGWLRNSYGVLDRMARDGAASSEAALVETLRTAAAELPQLSEQDVRDELLTLLLAGYETTAVSLTWAWWLLDQHPAVADDVREEIEAVIGDRDPTYDDVERLHLTRAVVAETLRLRPPAWINERAVVGGLELGAYRPKPGTLLLIPTWVLHRDPRWWHDAEAFWPQRWLDADGHYDEKAPGQPRGAYLPFGAGAHACIGSAFAWTEAVLALAVLLPQWQPTLAPDADVRIRATITLRPARGMPMHVAAIKVRHEQRRSARPVGR